MNRIAQIKQRLEDAITMRNYKGECRITDSCTDPSVCMAKDLSDLLEAYEVLATAVEWEIEILTGAELRGSASALRQALSRANEILEGE